ncbi:MAG: N-acyl-D-amino-acid deacylase family protein [Anaerolineae bacterium]
MFDLLVTNGRIVDGGGNPWFRGDVGVTGERIAAIGLLAEAEAKITLDAGGAIVCPGFIDVHAHSDLPLLSEPRHEPKVRQGVTTEVMGNCGWGFAPASPETLAQLLAFRGMNRPITQTWTSVAEFLSLFDHQVAINVAYLLPHSTLRIEAMGWEDRNPSRQELERMKELVAQGMADGAVGISTGLDYPPSSFASTDELIEICRTVSRLGGIYVSHTRDISHPEQALGEAMRIGEKAGIPVHISHLKAVGPENRGRAADRILPIVDRAREKGLDVTFDSYPYEAGSGSLKRVLPDWIQEGGPDGLAHRLRDSGLRARAKKEKREIYGLDWDKIYLVALPSEKNKDLVGKNLIEAAAMRQVDPVDLAWDLLVEENLECTTIFFLEAEEDIQTIMRHPAQMVCSDSLLEGQNTHPRTFGTFPRILGRYVRELGVLRLEEAVRKMTSFPAQRFGLKGRGLLKEGFVADLVVFDEGRVRDTAGYWDSRRYPEGIAYVVVNGRVVVDQGRHTGALPGRALGPGSSW